MINECGAVGRRIGGGNRNTGNKLAPMPLFHHKPHMIQPGIESGQQL
jgi:hypothetical protein